MKTNPIARAYRFLIRMDVAAWLLLLALLLATLGSCFPQRPSLPASDAAGWQAWEAGLRSRYGQLTDLMIAAGAFRFQTSPLFLASLILLTLSTLLCTLDRWGVTWRRAFRQEVRCAEVTFRTATQAVRLVVPTGADLIALLRAQLAANGFRVRTATVRGAAAEGDLEGMAFSREARDPDETAMPREERDRRGPVSPGSERDSGATIFLRADRNRLSPIGTLASHLGVVLLFLAAMLSSGFAWREQLTVGPDQPARLQQRPELSVQYESFAIERYLDGSAAQYDAGVVLLDAGRPVADAHIRVNRPLTYRGIGLYLQEFATSDQGTSLTLLAAHDPGYGPLLAAGFLTLLGLTVSFNLPHCCIRARVDPEGSVWLAGRADRRACDFDRQFTDIVAQLKRELVLAGAGGGEQPC